MPEIQFNGKEWDVAEALQAFYTPYASYVIQTRALPDARDGLKCGARFILYAQYKDKLTIKEKKRKAVATVNAAMRFSPHGDSSILGTAVRLSQDFSTRYPIIEVQGNNGSVVSGDDYSQSRYLEMRGGQIAWEMTELLNKETVDDWKLNYTEEEQYPTVLPTRFPYSLVNGSFGIGVACSSSIPPHNLNDVCTAAIKLLNNPEIDFEEIYCPIDFPTGGTIINEEEVKQSLKNGNGKAALVRATVEYEAKDNELIVTEIPYMTYTSTIVKSIAKALEDNLISGVENVIDGTDIEGCKIFIQLAKNANPNKVIRLLYKHTALQSSFSINMNALEHGKVPKLFTWKELMQAYLNHLRDVIVKAYQFDLKKIKKRLHILEGLIIAYHNMDEVVKIIRQSNNTQVAESALVSKFNFTDEQADAILKMRLSSLTHLEVEKLEKEKSEKEVQAKSIETILSSDELIKNELEKELKRLMSTYGDSRRTKQLNLDFKNSKDEDAEPIEKKELLIHFTNLGNIYTQESSTLMTVRRGGKGSKLKIGDKEIILQSLSDDNLGTLLLFSNKGQMYSLSTSELPINGKINVSQLFSLSANERINLITTVPKKKDNNYFVFITKNGMIKKTKAEEYCLKRGKSTKAINLKDGDEVVSIHLMKNEPVGILTSAGNYVIIDTETINPIGRISMGVKAIKLNEEDNVIDAKPIHGDNLITISSCGLIKKSSIGEFGISNRGIKGKQISGIREEDFIVKFLTIKENCDIMIVSDKGMIKFNTSELKMATRTSTGVKGISLPDNIKVVDLIEIKK